MKLQITHTTKYSYSKLVNINPHYIQLKPQDRSYLQLLDFELEISPNPATTSERLDAENNSYFQVWMAPVPQTKLSIKATVKVEVESFNPFQFIIDPPVRFMQNRFHYREVLKDFLVPYISEEPVSATFFASFLNERIKGCDKSCMIFITDLLSYLDKNFEYVRSELGENLDAISTFNSKTGSCKDLSWMLIQMLRCTGLAARFVSGYAFNPALGDGHELHGWVEVLLPGAGWIGLDPSSGLFCNETYIPVAASFAPFLTMPVTGSFAGDATSKLKASVEIQEIS